MAFCKFLTLTLWSSVCCTSAQAIQIAPPEGTPRLGRPLELTLTISMDIGQGWDSACLQAEMLQGNDPAAAQRLMATPIGASQGGQQRVRLQSRAPVTEPWVDVQVRAGCTQPQLQTYTVLAEAPLPAPVAPPLPTAPVVAPAKLPAPTPFPVARPAKAVQPAPPAAKAAPSRKAQAQASKPPAPAERKVEARGPVTAPVPARAPAGAPVARLKLEPLSDLLIPSAAAGAASAMTVAAATTAAAETPAPAPEAQPLDAAARSETAPSAQSVVAMAELTERAQALEKQVEQWQAKARQESARAQGLQQRLDALQEEQVPVEWFWGAMGALGLALLALVAVVLRRRGADRKQRKVAPKPQAGVSPTVLAEGEDEAFEAFYASIPGQAPAQAQEQEDVLPTERMPIAALPSGQPGQSPAAAALDDALSTLLPRELMGNNVHPATAPMEGLLSGSVVRELQQQVEFFTSIGENDQAVALLEQQLLVHGRCAPTLHLELLRLLHMLIRTDAFERARQNMQQHFLVQVPEFGQFGMAANQGLLDMPQVLDPIVAAWGTPQVANLIEQQLLRTQPTLDAAGLPLEAFEDLLLLHVLSAPAAAAVAA